MSFTARTVSPAATDTIVGEDGSVSYIPSGGGARTSAGTISLAQFPNEEGLTRVSGNRWVSDPASGAEIVGTPGGTYGVITSGTLSPLDMYPKVPLKIQCFVSIFIELGSRSSQKTQSESRRPLNQDPSCYTTWN